MMPKSWSSDSTEMPKPPKLNNHPAVDPLSPEITASDILHSLDLSYSMLLEQLKTCYDEDIRFEFERRLETVKAMRTYFRSQRFLTEVREARKK